MERSLVPMGMRNTIIGTLMLLTALTSGCALRVVHPIPSEATVYVPAPRRDLPRRELPRHVPATMSRQKAIARGEVYCHQRGYDCQVRQAHLAKGGEVWKVFLDARSRRTSGQVHLELDSHTGRILKADEKGKLQNQRRRHG